MSVITPPRKRDAVPGKYQLGVFIRAPDGSTLESVNHEADDAQVKAVLVVIGPRKEETDAEGT